MTDQISAITGAQPAALPPDHRLLLGRSPAWLDAARALLARPQHPMLAWRVRFGLVQVASADGLAAALRQACNGHRAGCRWCMSPACSATSTPSWPGPWPPPQRQRCPRGPPRRC